jgi:hypothetical protein
MSPFVPVTLVVQLLLAQTASVANEPATRGSTLLPVSARSFAQAFGLGTPEASTLLLRVIHLAYERTEAEGRRTRESLERLLATPESAGDVVPLPMGPRVWRTQILQSHDNGENLVGTILRDRRAALLYVGLSALDDETLTWLGSDPATLAHVRKFPEIFAAFGRSVRVRSGRIVVAGGDEAEPLWKAIVGVDPGRPEAFVEHLIGGSGRLAFLFDTIAHLDPPHQRFALGLHLGPATREARFRALLAAFTAAAPEWRIGERFFPKPPIDGALLLSTLRVLPNGSGAPPIARRLWDRVFRADELNEVPFQAISDAATAMTAPLNVDAAWLADRVLRVPYAVGRRRLDALLFAQRVFGSQTSRVPGSVATALRGYLSFPALAMSLERSGVIEPDLFVCAAEHAARLTTIESPALRKSSVAQFQAAIALIERIHRSGVLDAAHASSLIRSACGLQVSSRSGYELRFAGWVRDVFLKALPARSSSEETMLGAIAGVLDSRRALPVVSWEGRRYRIDPALPELERLRRVRQRQGVQPLDTALLVGVAATEDNRGTGGDQALADTLVSMVYAVYLGDPEGSAVTSGNVALRHDFGFAVLPSRGAGDAWRPPIEHFDSKTAWRIRGSVLGLDTALARLSLRRLDPSDMPGEPRIGAQDRQTLMLTVAVMNPFALSDAARDDVTNGIAIGRARVAALSGDQSKLDEVARDAGLSEWRRHALAWALTQHRDIPPLFSLLELFWLGTGSIESRRPIDEWGAAVLPLTGCFCLAIPERGAWEDLRGYASAVLATRGADISLRIAETLSTLKLPAALAPGLAGFVTQDVIDHAGLADPDDWEEFGRAVRDLPEERMFDYIAALAAGGPLVADDK